MPRGRRKKRVVDLEKYPIKVGDYVKVNLSGLGSDLYQIEEIHENGNYTVVMHENELNGSYQHRLGENGTMFATGKPGYKKTNLKNRITKV